MPGAGAPRGHRKRLRWISVGVVSGKPELELRKCGEPPVGIEPTTYALRRPSTPPPPPATCDFSAARTALGPSVYFIGRQFASQAVSRGRVRRGGRHAQGSAGHSRRDLTPAGGQQLRRLHLRLFTVNRHDRHRCLTRCRMCSVTGTSSGLFTDGSSGTGTASGTSQTHSARGGIAVVPVDVPLAGYRVGFTWGWPVIARGWVSGAPCGASPLAGPLRARTSPRERLGCVRRTTVPPWGRSAPAASRR